MSQQPLPVPAAAPAAGDHVSLVAFILRRPANKRYLLIALAGMVVQFIIFKFLYPYPDFISDSYSYIDTNLHHMKVNLWPIGYSKFIAAVHWFTASHVFLVGLQYVISTLALLYFFYSVLYLYGLSKTSTLVLYIFLFFNPMFLYLANCVLSDTIFCALSLTLFTQYLWMYRRPSIYNLVVQALLIGVAFTIRYTAIYYPLVSIVAILVSGYKLPVKLTGMAAPWLLILPFIHYTQERTKEVTGTAEFSVFGGWQIANNALYMYDHIDVDSTQLPEGTLELDRLARYYFSVVPPEKRVLADIQGTFFIKVPNAILKPYMAMDYAKHGAPHDARSSFRAWGMVSPVYKAYGTYLIKHHPFAFMRYYMWLNTKNYFIPYPEKFGSYNIGMRQVWEPARIWFNLKSNDITLVPSIEFQGYLFLLYPMFFMVLNIYFAFVLGYFLFSGNLKHNPRRLNMAIIAATAFLVINFGFSVFATPVVLRYQVVPMILLLYFSLLLTERLLPLLDDKQPVVATGRPVAVEQ